MPPLLTATIIKGLVSGVQLIAGLSKRTKSPIRTTSSNLLETGARLKLDNFDPNFGGQTSLESSIINQGANQVGLVRAQGGGIDDLVKSAAISGAQINSGLNNIAQIAVNNSAQREQRLNDFSRVLANEDEKNFYQNVVVPANEQKILKNQLIGSGIKGLGSALGDFATIASGERDLKNTKDTLAKISGTTPATPVSTNPLTSSISSDTTESRIDESRKMEILSTVDQLKRGQLKGNGQNQELESFYLSLTPLERKEIFDNEFPY